MIQNFKPDTPLVINPLYSVSNESMRKLRPGTWLNDELINAYATIVNKRLLARSDCRMMCLNTWFVGQLENELSLGTYDSNKVKKRL